ncbi:hypothetical protein Q4595_30575, partial [Wenyingzhuangia sp. 1_MG-2023]|nr:hypothetical protein [Wenyingzhuangia sp. 1_MG-2023]
MTLGIEFPTMEGAADTAFFLAAETHIGTPVRTMTIHQHQFIVFVTEEGQFFTQQVDGYDRAVAVQ